MLKLFRQICYAVRALHTHQLPAVPISHTEQSDSVASQPNSQTNLVPFAHRDIKPGCV